MEASGGRWVAKGGAEGLQCLGLPQRGLGLALKCEDGSARSVPPATITVLEQLGEIPEAEAGPLAEWRRPIVRNHAGLEVGRLEAHVRAFSPAAG